MKPRRQNRWLWLGGAAALLTLAAWMLPNLPPPRSWEKWPAPDSGWQPWQPWFEGVDYTRGNFTQPRPLKVHAIRVDLSTPGVEVLVNPPSQPGNDTCGALYATQFLQQHHLQVVVSAGAFLPFAKWPGVPVDPIGIMISDGLRWSEPVSNLHALVVTRDHRVKLTTNQFDTADAWQAIGANWITLRGGTNLMEPLGIQPSSVAGCSADGRILYWLIADGRQPGWSEGVTPGESAAMLRSLGATEAIRMDDGSVVTLAKAGGWRGAQVINRPSHPYIIGMQRPIGSLLGIRARPLGSTPQATTAELSR